MMQGMSTHCPVLPPSAMLLHQAHIHKDATIPPIAGFSVAQTECRQKQITVRNSHATHMWDKGKEDNGRGQACETNSQLSQGKGLSLSRALQ